METVSAQFDQLAGSSRHLVRRLLTMGETRLELLVVEVQEAREHLLHAMMLALGIVAFGFLALLALNVAVVLVFWNRSPLVALLLLAAFHAAAAAGLYWRFRKLLAGWKLLVATLDQLRKDRKCLETKLT